MPHFAYSSVDGHLSCFPLYEYRCNENWIRVSVPVSVFGSFAYIPRGSIIGLHSNSVLSFLRKNQTFSIAGAPFSTPAHSPREF